MRFAPQPRLQLLDRLAGQRALRKAALHPLDRPEQIDRGRTRRGHQVAGLLELRGELPGAGRLAALHPERDAHRRRHADRGRAANHHRLDGLGDVVRGLAPHVHLGRRQLALVDHHDDVVFPGDRRKHYGVIVRSAVFRVLSAGCLVRSVLGAECGSECRSAGCVAADRGPETVDAGLNVSSTPVERMREELAQPMRGR